MRRALEVEDARQKTRGRGGSPGKGLDSVDLVARRRVLEHIPRREPRGQLGRFGVRPLAGAFETSQIAVDDRIAEFADHGSEPLRIAPGEREQRGSRCRETAHPTAGHRQPMQCVGDLGCTRDPSAAASAFSQSPQHKLSHVRCALGRAAS